MRKTLLPLLLGLMLVAAGCSRKPRSTASSAPPPPPPPNYFQLGQQYYDAGDYPNAIQAYTKYLHDHEGAENGDVVLLRLALANAVAEGSARNLPQANQFLQQLVSQYPKSPYRPQAELLLRLQDDANRLRADLGKREADLAKRDADLAKRDDRIKELTKELEKLKQIDMERRPARVPP